MKSAGVLLVVSLLYLNGLCTANEGVALLAFTKDLDDTMGCLRGNLNTAKNWNSSNTNNYCGWSGVMCNNENSVKILFLGDCGLSGTLGNNGLANLKNLQELFLFNNSITGNIPEEIGSLTDLVRLDLSNNSLNGTLPSTLSNLKKLLTLNLYMNSITGNIPEEIGSLPHLELLDLSENFLEGTLPSTLSNLRMLISIDLSNNHLNGTLPYTLNMHFGGYINLSYNLLSGSVPDYWVKNIIPVMSEVDLTFNMNLTGKCTEQPCSRG